MIHHQPSTRAEIIRFKKMCAGKVKHKCRLSAEYVLQQTGGFKTNQEIYRCEFCQDFHIGTSKTKKRCH